MDYSVYKISLDIHKPEAQEVLEMKFLDSKRRIQISLTENGKVYQITPDCKAMFSAKKSDGNKIYNQCEIVDNTIIYDVTRQTLACLGEVDCEVQLLGSDEAVITSSRFIIIVHNRVYNGEEIVDSEMETDILPNLVAKSHEHANKEVLDGITQELLDQIGTGGGGLTPQQLAELTANTAARHEHENKDLLDSITKEMLAEEIPAVHILPENAKDGDLILYAPQNILPECGRRIYVDWEKFKEPVNEENFSDFGITAYNSQGTETLEIVCGRGSIESWFTFVSMVGGSAQCILSGIFINGVTDGFSLTINDEETPIYNIDDLPKYFEIPQFDTIDTSGSTGNEYLFHTEYRLMKYQGGEWVEAVEVPEISGGGGDLSQFIEEVSKSVNLYPPMTEGWTDYAFIKADGTDSPSSNGAYCITPLIPINPNTTYTIKPIPWGNLGENNRGKCYDKSGNVLAQMEWIINENTATFTTPDNSSTVRFTVRKTDFDNLPNSNNTNIELIKPIFNNSFMLVEGETAPENYEPFGDTAFRLKNIMLPNKSVDLENVKDDALSVFAPLAGKTIVNFGDSIFGNQQQPNDISTFLAEKSGATVYNCGFGGCRMSVHPTAEYNAFCMYNLADAVTTKDFTLQNEAVASGNLAERYGVGLERLKGIDFSKIDIVTIAYGSNDYAGVPLENEDNPLDTSTFGGALRYSIEKLLTAYPNLKIFVLSAAYRFWIDDNNEFTEDSNTRVNSIGLKLGDYNTKLKEVAEEYNLPYVDDYNIGIGKFNRYQYFNTNDGAHHKEEGRRLIAEHLATALSTGNNIPDSSIDKVTLSTSSATLNANRLYDFGVTTELTINFAKADPTKYNEYSFSFTSGATPTVLTLPDTVKWANELTVEANKRYEISIVDNIGLWCAVEVSK